MKGLILEYDIYAEERIDIYGLHHSRQESVLNSWVRILHFSCKNKSNESNRLMDCGSEEAGKALVLKKVACFIDSVLMPAYWVVSSPGSERSMD